MYTAEVSRNNPSAFLFVIDQSGSMDERMESEQTKAQFVADVLNRTLYQLVIRCTRADGVRNYFDVGVIAYGATVGSGFTGALGGKLLHPLSEIEANPSEAELAKKLGYKLCRCSFPPEIMLWNKDHGASFCPKCNDRNPVRIDPDEEPGDWVSARFF